MVNRATAKTKKSDLRLKSDIPDQPVFVRGDAEKLSWVLLQLIDNAIKFTSGGGSVTLSVKPKPDGRFVAVVVQDTGIGITEADQRTIFAPFTQIDNSSTREHGGAGLGLAIVKHYVEAHGGRVLVRSHQDEGSAFTVRLPLLGG